MTPRSAELDAVSPSFSATWSIARRRSSRRETAVGGRARFARMMIADSSAGDPAGGPAAGAPGRDDLVHHQVVVSCP